LDTPNILRQKLCSGNKVSETFLVYPTLSAKLVGRSHVSWSTFSSCGQLI